MNSWRTIDDEPQSNTTQHMHTMCTLWFTLTHSYTHQTTPHACPHCTTPHHTTVWCVVRAESQSVTMLNLITPQSFDEPHQETRTSRGTERHSITYSFIHNTHQSAHLENMVVTIKGAEPHKNADDRPYGLEITSPRLHLRLDSYTANTTLYMTKKKMQSRAEKKAMARRDLSPPPPDRSGHHQASSLLFSIS